MDRALAEGLIHLEETTGPHGIPMGLATDPDMDGWFEAQGFIDHAAAALERARKEDKNPEPGQRYRIVNTRPSAPSQESGDPKS